MSRPGGKPFSVFKASRGFTLLEVIVTIVIASVLGVMLVTFMDSKMTHSVQTVILAQSGSYINQVMENMTADYKYLMATDASPLATFSGRVGPEGSTRTDYGTGPYTIIDNHRISFPSGSSVTEQVDAGGKILKVTIGYGDLTLTALFTE